MNAQALINLHEWLDAIKAAEKCIVLQPNWWVSHQTLGRAQMGLGEVKLGLRSFQIALHLNPEDKELREDDLQWAFHILNEKEKRDGNTKDISDTASSKELNSIRFRS